MQLRILVHLDKPFTMPISYHHILQAIIYKLMGDSEGVADLHDGGENFGKRIYKFFTFSQLEGKYKVLNKKITFFDTVSFEIRSIDDNILKIIEDNVLKDGITFGNTVYTDVECIRRNKHITKDIILINMISPVCVHKTLQGSTHTNYLNPLCPDFSSEINSNFKRKYLAAGNKVQPELSDNDGITIAPVKVNQKDKYLTTYKSTIIEAYHGVYALSGKPEYLDFLFNVGIGSKNSQGFGMFNVFQS